MTDTSRKAYRRFDAEPLKKRVLGLVQQAGQKGAIWEEIRAAIQCKDGSLSPRITELCAEGLLCRNGDERPSSSGQQQLVVRDIKFSTVAPQPIKPRKKTGFGAGLAYAEKLITEAASVAAGMAQLSVEVNKHLKGS